MTHSKLFLLAFVLIAIPFFGTAYASCEVEEVIELVGEELSRTMIKEECDNRVVDAGRCSLSKVIRYAKRGYDAEEIYDKCEEKIADDKSDSPGRNFASACYTNFGSCPMRVALPVGSSCICYTYSGNFPGVAR